jgi:predicted DNA-binding transcriptional regulator YafY
VTLPTATTQWLARLFLRLGPDAEVLEPAGLRDEVVAQARETLARYSS